MEVCLLVLEYNALMSEQKRLVLRFGKVLCYLALLLGG